MIFTSNFSRPSPPPHSPPTRAPRATPAPGTNSNKKYLYAIGTARRVDVRNPVELTASDTLEAQVTTRTSPATQ